ncbi:MAG: sensor histidine kinase [Chitinophagaceae bacterium]
MKSLFFFVRLILLPVVSFSQAALIDSLESKQKKLMEDTVKVNFLNDMILKYQHVNPERAMALAGESAELAKRLAFKFGLGAAYRLTGVLYVDKSEFDKAAEFYNKAQELFKDQNDNRSQTYKGMLQHNFGVIYHYKGQYDSAVIFYQSAARIYNEFKNDGLLFLTYNNLSTLYTQILDNTNALKYAKQCMEISRRLNDPYKISVASLAMASAKSELKDYQGMDTLVDKVISVSKQSGNYYMLGMGYKFLGKYQIEFLKDVKISINSYKAALDNMTKAGNEYEIASANHNLGYSYFLNGNDEQAIHHFKTAIAQSKKLGLTLVEQYTLKTLSELEEKRNNFPAAYNYLKSFVTINDSVIAKTHQENIQALEVKYQSEIKDARIAQLAGEKQIQALSLKQKSTLNYVLAGSVAALLITGFLVYRNLRHRHRLVKQQEEIQQQRIRELEKDRQLIAVDSMLKGQEEERSRLAKDLHDGLGGLLSGVKFSLSNMKDNLIVTPDNMAVFERSLDMLDTSIKELRRVAHNMMPEMLTKFGLDEALKDYCGSVNATKLLEVKYQSLGMDSRLDNSTEIIIYRIIQELLNNILKHAAASESFVQLIRDNDRLNIVVEDNGKGFDTALLESNKGAGWANIRSRVEYLKGRLDIHSEPGKGTLVNIEFIV